MHSKRNETEDRNLSSFRPESSPDHQVSPFRHEVRMNTGANFPAFDRQAFSQMPHSSTFMTSAFGDHNYRMDGYLDDKQEELKNTYNALQNVIADLDVSFDRVLERHEKDFLSAYRGHMMKVQRELNFLRNKAKEQEIKLKKDERINNLQNSLDWFRKEALKLGKTCEFQKKEIDKYKAKSDSYEEDMKFLQQQIKAAKKQNKLLKVALGKSQHQCEQLIAIAQENLPHQKMESILREQPQSIDFSEEQVQMRMGITSSSFNTRVSSLYHQEPPRALPAPDYMEQGPDITKQLDIDGEMPTLPQMIPELESQEKKDSTEIAAPLPPQSTFMPRNPSSRPKTSERKKTLPLSNAKNEFSLPGNKRFQNFLVNLFETNPDRPTLMSELATFFNQYDQRVEEVISNLKGQLEAEKRLSRKLKNIKTEQISERNKYENIFFDCVEAVKRQVLKRKNAQSQSRLMTKKSESTLRKLSKADEPEFTDLLKTKPENFTVADKKKVLETFVINEEILLAIYEQLFVKNKPAMSEKMRRTNQPSFTSNPLSSGGLDIELENQKYREAFLTKVPGQDDEKDLVSGRMEQKPRFKTSVMPQSVNHGIGHTSMLGEYTSGARRVYSSQPSTKARTTAQSFNLAPGKIRRSKNSELIRGVEGSSKIRSATRGTRPLYQ